MDGEPTLLLDTQEPDFEALITRIYVAMVRQRQPNMDALLALGFNEAEITEVTQVLESRELIDAIGAGAWRVRPPEVSLHRLAMSWETRAQFARASATELSGIWRQAQQTALSGSVAGMRALKSAEEVTEALVTVSNDARETFAVMLDDAPAGRAWLLRDRFTDEVWERRPGLRERYLVASALLDDEEVLAELQRRSDAGVSVRFVQHIPFGMMTADNLIVVCDGSRYSEDASGSFVHRGGPGVTALGSLVDTLYTWGAALPSSRAPGDDHPSAGHLDQRDRRILGLLGAGATDQQIARQLGVSTRTVERRVRNIMDGLGTTTRFQAGVAATRRDWL